MENQAQSTSLSYISNLLRRLIEIPLQYWTIVIVLFLILLNLFTTPKSPILQLNTSNTVDIDTITSTTSKLMESKLFCINETLILNNYYQIRIEYLGTQGFATAIFWKHDSEKMIDFLSNYQPLDSQTLNFQADEQYQQSQKCFYVIPYQISYSIRKKKEQEIKYIIEIRELIIAGLSIGEILHYSFVIIFPLFIVLFLKKKEEMTKNIYINIKRKII